MEAVRNCEKIAAPGWVGARSTGRESVVGGCRSQIAEDKSCRRRRDGGCCQRGARRGWKADRGWKGREETSASDARREKEGDWGLKGAEDGWLSGDGCLNDGEGWSEGGTLVRQISLGRRDGKRREWESRAEDSHERISY